MCEIPVEVEDGEKIVRAVIAPFHFDEAKLKLRIKAFRSRAGTDEVSVVRGTYKGPEFCKAKGCEAAAAGGQGRYVGLAVLTARQVRDAKSRVSDSRAEYCGHAHISHGITKPPDNEPFPADLNLALDRKLRALRDAATMLIDPQPLAGGWSGPPL